MKELDMTKYAALVLGLLVTSASFADTCYTADPRPECRAAKERELQAFEEIEQRSKAERESYYQRTQPVQVITPNSSYLAYPSGDGSTVQVFGGTGRGFDRD